MCKAYAPQVILGGIHLDTTMDVGDCLLTPNDVMAGVLTNRGIPDKVVVSYPRKGGKKITLEKPDRRKVWALILKQNGVK